MTTTSQPDALIAQALPNVDAWTERLCQADALPVLERTSLALEAWRLNEERADANGLGQLIATDPLMTLKVLAHVSTQRHIRAVTDMETVTAALVMMGIPPFFKAFGLQPSVEERLADYPQALAGLRDTLRRADRAATFALAFAVHRMDPDAPVIHAATLLHDFAELLVWIRAPVLGLRIDAAQRQDPSLRSSAAQRAVLNVELVDLQQSLMKKWRLPELLVRINDDRHAASANVRCVTLAIRLARHSAHGWDNAALPDDIDEVADLLNMSPVSSLEFVQTV